MVCPRLWNVVFTLSSSVSSEMEQVSIDGEEKEMRDHALGQQVQSPCLIEGR